MTITQADREAAAEAVNPPDGWNPAEWATEILAQHREQAAREALERAAKLCDEMGAYEQEGYGLDRAAQNYFRARNAIRALAPTPPVLQGQELVGPNHE